MATFTYCKDPPGVSTPYKKILGYPHGPAHSILPPSPALPSHDHWGRNQQLRVPVRTQLHPRPPGRPRPRHAPSLERRRNVVPVLRTSAATSAAARAARGRQSSRARSCRALGPAGWRGPRPARVGRTDQRPLSASANPQLPDARRRRMPAPQDLRRPPDHSLPRQFRRWPTVPLISRHPGKSRVGPCTPSAPTISQEIAIGSQYSWTPPNACEYPWRSPTAPSEPQIPNSSPTMSRGTPVPPGVPTEYGLPHCGPAPPIPFPDTLGNPDGPCSLTLPLHTSPEAPA